MIKEAPGFRKQPFIDGISMYETFVEAEQDSARRELLIDTVFMLYDKRIQCHDEAGFVLGRKGYSMYKLGQKITERSMRPEGIFQPAGNKAEYFLIPTYFNYTIIQWKLKTAE